MKYLLVSLLLASAVASAQSVTIPAQTVTGTVTATIPAQTITIPDGATAAIQTANSSKACQGDPFFWEIGTQTGPIVSGQVGANPPTRDTVMAVASASKLLDATYVAQIRGGKLTADDIDFLHQTSGYTNMADESAGGTCLASMTVAGCLGQTNATNGQLLGWQNPKAIGAFFYNGAQFQEEALSTPLANDTRAQLGADVSAALGVSLSYSETLVAGGADTSAAVYATVLQRILSGKLLIRDLLGTSPVCTLPGSPACPALYSPLTEPDHYSMGHWVEDAPGGDGAFSSAGSFGFVPWIDASKHFYGVLARHAAAGSGQSSMLCARAIRKAYFTRTPEI